MAKSDNPMVNYVKLLDHIEAYKGKFPNQDDCNLVTIWQKKLEAYECESSHEMELVNEILTNLLQCCTNRTLTEPFNAAPPEELVLEQLIISGNPQNTNKATAMKARIPELFEISPDNGDFLMEQPVPRSGVFCYLAVINKEPSKK